MKLAQDFVYEAIDIVNGDPSVVVKIDKNPSFLLLDQDSLIDSLTLVNLFVGIESLIEDRLAKIISIVNEDSFESAEYPFRNVGNLVEYIQKLLDQ
jgi:acyl carrier protein